MSDLIKKANSLLDEGLLNEGSSRKTVAEIAEYINDFTADVIKGAAGKNGSNDPAHPNKKEIQAAMKDISKTLKTLLKATKGKYDSGLWVRTYF